MAGSHSHSRHLQAAPAKFYRLSPSKCILLLTSLFLLVQVAIVSHTFSAHSVKDSKLKPLGRHNGDTHGVERVAKTISLGSLKIDRNRSHRSQRRPRRGSLRRPQYEDTNNNRRSRFLLEETKKSRNPVQNKRTKKQGTLVVVAGHNLDPGEKISSSSRNQQQESEQSNDHEGEEEGDAGNKNDEDVENRSSQNNEENAESESDEENKPSENDEDKPSGDEENNPSEDDEETKQSEENKNSSQQENFQINNDPFMRPSSEGIATLAIGKDEDFYRYPLQLLNLYKQRKKTTLVVGVLSSAKSIRRRQIIRRTWAKNTSFQEGDVSVFFIVASEWPTEKEQNQKQDYTEVPSFKQKMQNEYETYKDILWFRSQDSYELLTYKTQAFLHAVHTALGGIDNRINSPLYDHLLKTDDDSYVNLPLLLKYLQSSPDVQYYGRCFHHGQPFRDNPNDKWYLSYEKYPYAHFPPFATGGGYVVSAQLNECVVTDVRNYGKETLLPWEDVSVGRVAQRCGAECTNSPLINNRKLRSMVIPYVQSEEEFLIWHERFRTYPKRQRDKKEQNLVDGGGGYALEMAETNEELDVIIETDPKVLFWGTNVAQTNTNKKKDGGKKEEVHSTRHSPRHARQALVSGAYTYLGQEVQYRYPTSLESVAPVQPSESSEDADDKQNKKKKRKKKEIPDPIVIGILSPPTHTRQRHVLRRTWMQEKSDNVHCFFVIPMEHVHGGDKEEVQEEALVHHDLILVSRPDANQDNREEARGTFSNTTDTSSIGRAYLTMAFVHAVNLHTKAYSYVYIIRDNTYLQISQVEQDLPKNKDHYWGRCEMSGTGGGVGGMFRYPTFAYGDTGFAVSAKFAHCAMQELHSRHRQYTTAQKETLSVAANSHGLSLSSSLAVVVGNEDQLFASLSEQQHEEMGGEDGVMMGVLARMCGMKCVDHERIQPFPFETLMIQHYVKSDQELVMLHRLAHVDPSAKGGGVWKGGGDGAYKEAGGIALVG